MICHKRPQTLAIIGNGFDLNHGYNTNYQSFAERVRDPCLKKFEQYCNTERIESWYLFEENIRILSEKFFLESMSEDCDFDNNRKEVRELTYIFGRIHVLLKDYLNRETSSKPRKRKTSIEKYLNNDAIAFNFNYTETAEVYTKNIIYIHGSLKENDIILGYDYRDEPCLAAFEDMQWSKNICRESLAFRRYFLGKKKYNPNSRKYQALNSGLKSYQHWENMGRGIDDEVESFIPEYNIIHRFLRKYRRRFLIPNINYKRIKTLVVLGHGIEADRVFIKAIAEKCIHLEKVVIYRYDGETDNSFNAKVDFFTQYCNKVEQIGY